MEKLIKIINTVLDNRDKEKVTSVSKSSKLSDDLGLDSLDLAELTVRIESEYDIDIFEDGIVSTVGEIFQKLNLNK